MTGSRAAELIVWAGTDAAWDAVRSARSWTAVRAFKEELERNLLDPLGASRGAVEVQEHHTVIRNSSIVSRLVIASSAPDRVEDAMRTAMSDDFMRFYWKPNVSALLLMDDSLVSFCVVGAQKESRRMATLCQEIEGAADGRLLLKNTVDRIAPYFRYEGIVEAGKLLALADSAFRSAAPSADCKIVGKSVLLEDAMPLAVELANGPGMQVQFESFLTLHGIEETMVVAAICENPHRYWRNSNVKIRGSRHEAIEYLRGVIREFRRNVGTIDRAFVSGVEV